MSRTIGIDLGTTHTALAVADLEDAKAPSEILALPQIVGKGSIDTRTLLPSFVYFAHESEGALPLPWVADRTFAVGEYARSRGSEAPRRLISSAKSWLCHSGVDRRKGLLPDGAPDDIERISPVEASYRYLEHLAEAYAHRFPGASLAEAPVVLTVPASFDASARDLTVEAALAAGFDELTLLEEPQAALYAWIESRGDGFRKDLHVGDVILVIDVGGGTTDFSAIEVADTDGSIELRRVAVGDHILLGGDNMDLALAHLAKQRLVEAGKEVDKDALVALTFAARDTKEKLLADPKLESAPIALAKKGSALMGATLRTDLTQDDVTRMMIDGFFPAVASTARPAVRPRVGLREIGLPYASEPAITKHLAAFLGKQAGAVAGGKPLLCPTAILFNGGVMKAERIRARIVDTIAAWMKEVGAPAPRVLEGADLDHAVARGAAYYGRVRAGKGLRIRGGTARAYYVGIEGAAPAVPGIEPPITALCVASMGMEEGTDSNLPPRELGVVVGEPVRFRFFGSTVRREDKPGDELESWKADEVEDLPPIEITLPSEGRVDGDVVAVTLSASVTEVGTLLLEAVPVEPLKKDERWKVELNVRSEAP